jgi:hypothetical protein
LRELGFKAPPPPPACALYNLEPLSEEGIQERRTPGKEKEEELQLPPNKRERGRGSGKRSGRDSDDGFPAI